MAEEDSPSPNPELATWLENWQQQLAQQGIVPAAALQTMQLSNPVVIPRNHHVEAVLAETEHNQQDSAVEQYLAVLRKPYEIQPTTAAYMNTDADADLNYQTFCGT